MRVAVVGSGGREHALAWALGQTAEVVVVPGNAGMARAGVACAPSLDVAGAVDLVVIGPEQPLVDGLADNVRSTGTAVFGPGAEGARLEGSKAHLKQVLQRAGVPTAGSRAFRTGDEAAAETFLRSLAPPWVVKTDGLAAGKGVLVAADVEDAVADVKDKLSGASFGDAGRTVVIEEGLTGREVSVLAICDGRTTDDAVVVLPVARDHKRVGDGDTGPNTGGMGAYSPLDWTPEGLVEDILATVLRPTVDQLRAQGSPFTGLLYAGLALTKDGPRVIEFNARFGDPEAQVLLARLRTPLAGVLQAAATGALSGTTLDWSADVAVTVVMAAGGYPGKVATGQAIDGIAAANALEGVQVIHAGTRLDDGVVRADGGRVLSVTATGPTLTEARSRAYAAVGLIHFPGAQWRTDIALAAAESRIPVP